MALPPPEARDLAMRQNLAARLVDDSGQEWLSPMLHAMVQ